MQPWEPKPEPTGEAGRAPGEPEREPEPESQPTAELGARPTPAPEPELAPEAEPGAPDGASSPGGLRAPDWPESIDQTGRYSAPPPPEDPHAYGPTFAWRGRVLWVLGAVLEFLGAALLIWLDATSGVRVIGLLPAVAVLVAAGVAYAAAWRGLGLGQAWPGSPTIVLAWALIIGGMLRSVLSLLGGTLLVPLEVFVGAWLLTAGDKPRPAFGWPSDRRSLVLTAFVILTEVITVAPYLPVNLPVVNVLAVSQDDLELVVNVQCPDPDALMTALPVTVSWTWHAADFFGTRSDRLTLEATNGGQGGLTWELDTFGSIPVVGTPGDDQLVLDMGKTGSSGSINLNLLVNADGTVPPFAVTAVFDHGGRWQTSSSASCG